MLLDYFLQLLVCHDSRLPPKSVSIFKKHHRGHTLNLVSGRHSWIPIDVDFYNLHLMTFDFKSSKMGVIILHGPHHSAEKSTKVGVSPLISSPNFDCAITYAFTVATSTSGCITTFAFTEFEIKQLASDFCKTLNAFSVSFSSFTVTTGFSKTSVIRNFPSTCSNFPSEEHWNEVKSSFEFSAIDKNVVIKQLLTAAVNKCSGDQMPGIPFGNCGGVATSIHPPAF
jgi:hypothetical protein